MNFGEVVCWIVVVGCGTGIIHAWIQHRSKIAEWKLQARTKADTNVQGALDALRQEIRAEIQALRDTATQYDLSFDTALQRMDRRVEGVERRIQEVETNRSADLRTGR
jgi:hypothetical protein